MLGKFLKNIGQIKKESDFFDEVIMAFNSSVLPYKIKFIIVAHALSTLPQFLESVSKIGEITGVILKSSRRDREVEEYIRAKTYTILSTTKESLKEDKEEGCRLIHELIPEGKKCIIIDIGGYFAPCLEHFKSNPGIKKKLLGIVEDTENGHQKYEKFISISDYPVFSVARSKLKRTEDYNVGKSIVCATEGMMHRKLRKRLEDQKTVAVIGFGKIGSSIATHLRRKHVNIVVYDSNPSVLLLAKSSDFTVCNKKFILDKASVIFCATGRKCLSVDDLRKLEQQDVVVSSCTSADDEFDLTGLPEPIDRKKYYGIYRLSDSDSKNVFLLEYGNAINFHYNALLGNYIFGVQAGLIACSLKLAFESYFDTKRILTLSDFEEDSISRIWLNIFENIEFGAEPIKNHTAFVLSDDTAEKAKENKTSSSSKLSSLLSEPTPSTNIAKLDKNPSLPVHRETPVSSEGKEGIRAEDDKKRNEHGMKRKSAELEEEVTKKLKLSNSSTTQTPDKPPLTAFFSKSPASTGIPKEFAASTSARNLSVAFSTKPI